MSTMHLAISRANETLRDETPNLMPFHISYTGPAPISTYLMVKTTQKDPPQLLERSTFVSAFRGRTIQASEAPLPQGYAGLVLKVDPQDPSQDDEKTTANQLKRPRRSESPSKPKKRMKEPMESIRRSKRATRNVVVVEEPTVTGDEDMYAMMSEVVVQEEMVSTQSAIPPSCVPSRSMLALASFHSILMWYPDVAVDDRRDEYLCTMDEWTRLAAAVHEV